MTSKIKVDNINKVSDDSNIINKCGTTITLGASGDTVNLASGASQTGFGRSGSVNWQTTPKTATFTPVNGEGYFINSGSALTANLPAGSAGAIVAFADYARNFATYNFTISPNGSEKIGGVEADLSLNVNGQAITLVYVDSTKGWVNVQNAEDTEVGQGFVQATGGTISQSGCYQIHTFTGPGTFAVSLLAPGPSGNPNTLEYIVVGGGGAGASGNITGGGGAGGFRFNSPSLAPLTYPAKPLSAPGTITAAVQSYPITVGGGGPVSPGNDGVASVFSTITSAGGGGSGGPNSTPGRAGGSGGGGNGNDASTTGGAGNTPPVSPPQGNTGGAARTVPGCRGGGGGGGALAVGGAGSPPYTGGPGGVGAGVPNGFGTSGESNGGFYYFSGGGGGGGNNSAPERGGVGGLGGGGDSSDSARPTGEAGADNTGGGGGGSGTPSVATGAGGSGIVIIRYKNQ